MIGRLFSFSFIPSMVVGVICLSIILWWGTGFTPLDLINAITDAIVEPLQGITG